VVTDQLIAYIKQQTQQGIPPENIKAILRANGWEDSDINQAMRSLNMSNFAATPISPIYVNLPLKPNAKNKYEDKKIVRPHKSSSWLFNIVATLVAVAGAVFALHLAFPNITSQPFGGSTDQSVIVKDKNLSEAQKTYLKIREEFDQTKNFGEFQALALRYGSKRQVAQIEGGKEELSSQPAEFLQNLFDKAKANSPKSSEITSIEEIVREDTSALKVFTSKNGVEGSVIMVLEDGSWKLELESWTGYGN